MENNFGGFNHLPNPNSFEKRNSYNANSFNGNNKPSSGVGRIEYNRYSADGKPIESLDGRKWETRDQAMVANKEYYKKLGRDINHKPENSEAFNLTNFYKFNKD